MHIADFSVGMLGANGIVGGGFGIAAGAALSASLRGSGEAVLCFFGDGAINQGAFHEVANMAAIWKLPLVLVCENNQYAMSARVVEMTSVTSLARRAEAYDFYGTDVDGMDVLVVHAAVAEAVARAREGGGPSLIAATCYRYAGHFSGDLMAYRDASEADSWLARDPVDLFARRLVADGVLTDADVEQSARAAEAAVDEALEFAQASPLPDPTEAWTDVYA